MSVCVPAAGSNTSPVTPVPEKVPPAGLAVNVNGEVEHTKADVKVMGLLPQMTVIEYDRVPEQPLASLTVTLKLNVPVAVGVPEMVPLAAIVRPGGNAPAVMA